MSKDFFAAYTEYHNKNAKGHVWKLDDYNEEVDIFAFDAGNHNGPMCIKCGYGFCHHCHPVPEEECSVE